MEVFGDIRDNTEQDDNTAINEYAYMLYKGEKVEKM